MSKTITTTKQSLIQLTDAIHLKDTITLQINSEYLNHNFVLIKQCLLKVQQLQNDMSKQKTIQQSITNKFDTLQNRIKQNEKSVKQHDNKIKQLQNNIGDDFMKKLYDIETKTKNTYDFDQTVRKLQGLNKFVSIQKFKDQQNAIQSLQNQIGKLKQQLNRYVENVSFDNYKESISSQLENIKAYISNLSSNNNAIEDKIYKISQDCNSACRQVNQNSKMIKEMNFSDLMDKIKKFRQDTDHKVGQLSIKLKKKCAITDLTQLENNIIQKLDKFFALNQKGKASINQTKQALLYLEKRVNQVYQLLIAKQGQDQNDALFSTKKVNCASCTKDLGKYQGKLGQFRPWAVFPCKQLDPQKTGGYGYLTYVDKMHNRRGSVIEETSLERLNKTFYQRSRQQQSPKKLNTTRTTRFMSSYGEQAKQIVSLKEQYFKEIKNDKNSNKIFRVKRDVMKPSTAAQNVKEKVKQI